MTAARTPRVFTIAPGVPFLLTLAESLAEGRLVPGYAPGADPLALADATIFVPTRRAARALRQIFAERAGGAALLPTVLPLGDVDEDIAWFDTAVPPPPSLDPPIDAAERLLLLAPLVRRWKMNLPKYVARLFAEEVTVPASTAEAVWLARDLAALIDEMETGESDWSRMGGIVRDELAQWWQVTLDFLGIVTTAWPQALVEMRRSNPAAHRRLLIDAETARLERSPPAGPVIAAGSTGSIPATARLLATIARLPLGAVVLPGLDLRLDRDAWDSLADPDAAPSVCGHPQFGLRRLVDSIGLERSAVEEIAGPAPALAGRAAIVSEALRPADTTERWAQVRPAIASALAAGALDGVTVLEAPNEREEALAIAVALRRAAAAPGAKAALVTPDRVLARRVSAELLRFGIAADDSAGTRLADSPPAMLLAMLTEAAMRPGDPLSILAFLKQPLLTLGLERSTVRRAVETIELVALRGGVGRPDIAGLTEEFEQRYAAFLEDRRQPPWFHRIRETQLNEARLVLEALRAALAPLVAVRETDEIGIAAIARASVEAFENAGRSADGGVENLYRGEAGEKLADLLRSLVSSSASLAFASREWPDVLGALIAPETVKPRPRADAAISIWGTLEARLQHVDLIVCGSLNEGSWPGRADPGGFLSRVMKAGLDLDPPERRIGQSAHDFEMAMGAPRVLLTRSARAGDAPAVASRWLQRLNALIGEDPAKALRARGARLLAEARHHAGDEAGKTPFAPRPKPTPPVDARPRHFSVTEIETLRRDPYAIYAKKVLNLVALDDLLRDPGASERGSLFHDILHRFTESNVAADAPDALESLLALARTCFDAAQLPADVDAVWWPRFRMMAPDLLRWERDDRRDTVRRIAEIDARKTEVGETGVTLSGRADRIDLQREGLADILDYKTGYSPSKVQAHRLVAPQLSLEGALLARGAFRDLGRLEPAGLAYVRLRATGKVDEESILSIRGSDRLATDLSEDAWNRLIALLGRYNEPGWGYLSRALPFRESDTDGDYDHLARVLEWSAGGEDGGEGGE